MKITIIGAGIGGLTTAIALQQKGIEVELFEAAPEIREVGAGITLAFNAMQVYERLGLADEICRAGHLVNRLIITDQKFQPISIINLQSFQQKYGVDMAAIHRGALQKILADRVGEKNIHLGKKLESILPTDANLTLQFEDGTKHQTRLLIGADGIHSQTRAFVTQKAVIRNANQPCWRGLTNFNLPEEYLHQPVEMWGKGKRFGFVYISDLKVYWYALTTGSPTMPDPMPAKVFKGFNPLVSQIIESTPSDQIIYSDLLDLKPITTWHSDKICLIGDAAHATTPNMGQGACQAVEDAWTISQCLAENEPALAFAKFQKQRIAKATKVVNRSWQIGKLAHLENQVGIWLRNTLMNALPQAVVLKQNEWIYDLGN